MTDFITKIMDSVTKMIEALEKEGASLVETLIQYSEKAAVTLEQVLRDAFDKVRRTLEGIASVFKSKLKSLEDKRRTTPESGEGFIAKIKSASSTACREAEVVIEKFNQAAEAIIGRCKEIIIKLGTLVERTSADAGKFITDSTKEFFEAVKTIVEKGVNESKTFVAEIEPTHNMDSSFTHTHNLEVATVASVSVFDPILIGSFILSVGIIVGASKYKA